MPRFSPGMPQPTPHLADIPSDVTNLKLVIQASEPHGNGITRAYSKAAAFADPYTPETTAIDIKSAYDNTAIGEKSEDVLVEGKLSS